jgi:hypothetical protein
MFVIGRVADIIRLPFYTPSNTENAINALKDVLNIIIVCFFIYDQKFFSKCNYSCI